jgi:aminodeoxyfutalosine synthase
MNTLFDKNLFDLAEEALNIKKQWFSNDVFFIRNIHVNYTDICVSHCKFCAFAKNEDDEDAYIMNIGSMLDYIKTYGKEAREIHIVGGLHPSKPFDFYLDMISSLKYEFPDKTIKAFSAVEIDYFGKLASLSTEKVLLKLKEAGLEMLPGGGAEIFAPRVRSKICPEKISGERWLEIMEIAHKNGIRSNATMLFGHLETYSDRINHLKAIKKLQDETGGFEAFIPLEFQPENTFLSDRFPPTGVDDLKTIAVSRIVLDNIPHIKAYWVMLGVKMAQVALFFGADDLDGTIVKENIAYAAGEKSGRSLTLDSLVNLIKDAGFAPVERDAFYNEIKRY